MRGSDELSKEELISLLETAGDLASQADPEQLVGAILEKACGMTNSPDGAVLLHDAERSGLYFAAARGTKAGELLEKWGARSSQRIPISSESSKAGQAFRSGQIDCSLDVADDAGHFKGVDEQTGKRSNSIVSVPLRFSGKSIGVLQVLNKQSPNGGFADYTPRDLVVLSHLAGLAATAITNALRLAKMKAHMGLYAQAGAQDLEERLDRPAQSETLTLLFADMRGFTQLCQSQADPKRTQKIMNDLFTMLADRVLSRGGIVNKFVGDSVFALFMSGAGPIQAVRCAFDMLERFDSLRRLWNEDSSVDVGFLNLGIGIATGPVALGSFGSAAVRDFTAIGVTVNLASAFESAARDGRRVLVDNDTWVAVRDIVQEYEGPTPFRLGKPGQSVVIDYNHYHLKCLKPDRPMRIFVSHNSQDVDFVERRIRQPLIERGIETWYSPADIPPGEKYVQAIEAGLLKCDWVLVAVSQNSAKSDWVKAECRAAIRDPRFHRRILPFQVDDTLPSQIGPEIGELESLDVRRMDDPGEALYQFLLKRGRELGANRGTPQPGR
jgi:class 3 adenylate cyclase